MLGLDVILGGVTGLIGNAFTTWFKYKNAKMEYQHEEKMVDLNTQAMIKKAEAQIKVAQEKVRGEVEIADSESYKISQQTGQRQLFHEKWIDMLMASGEKKWYGWIFTLLGTLISALFAFVDWMNAMMRPSLTVYLVGASSYITYMAWEIMQKNGLSLTAQQSVDIYTQVTSTMIYLAVSAVTWWFGDRTMSKFLQQKGNNNKEKK
jgi:cation transport ATPase